MSLEKQLVKDYEERLLNYLLHRRENYVLEVNLRHIAKAFGWTGKSKLVRQALEQLVALLTALACLGAGVGLVHDDELGAEALEGLASALGLDVVQANDRVGVGVEH